METGFRSERSTETRRAQVVVLLVVLLAILGKSLLVVCHYCEMFMLCCPGKLGMARNGGARDLDKQGDLSLNITVIPAPGRTVRSSCRNVELTTPVRKNQGTSHHRAGFVLLTDLRLTLRRLGSHSADFASLRSPRHHLVSSAGWACPTVQCVVAIHFKLYFTV